MYLYDTFVELCKRNFAMLQPLQNPPRYVAAAKNKHRSQHCKVRFIQLHIFFDFVIPSFSSVSAYQIVGS
jgi:hypothetical protein